MDDVVEVEKSPHDSKSYRVIRLDNGLTATLISEGLPSADDISLVSAAGLCVGIGSFSEPDRLPGLAHFMEHMVFMGSIKFPGENDFDKFIKAHGGSTNAHTHMEKTIFYFDIQSTHFKEGLERFAQFFISPLLNKECMQRELNLVHAEWAMTVHQEKSRFEQLLGSFARPGHPMGKFSWGNSASLKTIPEQNNIDVHLELQNFGRKYYLAQFMTLTVLSKEALDDLESWVMELFADVPFNADPKPSFLHHGLESPFSRAAIQAPQFFPSTVLQASEVFLYDSDFTVSVIPAKNVRLLQLTWALDSQLQNYRKKPLAYLGNLVGHEGEGSLLLLLRKRNWARHIHSGNAETSQEHNSTWAQFNVFLSLTEEGLKNVIDVITLVFQYLNLLRYEGPQKRLWMEMHKIDQNEFEWIQLDYPQEYVHLMALDMQTYRPSDFITGRRVMMEYDEQLIQNCLDRLRPDQMNVAVWSKTFESQTGVTWQIEPWYQTYYIVQDIERGWLQKWSDCETSSELFLPRPNMYIASDFELKDPDFPIKNLEDPISSSTVSRLWFRPDNDFHVPKAYINFYLKSVVASQSAINMCMTDFYVSVLKRLVSVVGYPAELAHLRYFIEVCNCGVVLRVQGFSDKLRDLFFVIVDRIAAFDLTEELYRTVENEMADFYHNTSLCPEKLNKELRRGLLQTKYSYILQKKESLKCVNKELLIDYAKRFYKGVFVEGLIQGNLTAQEAQVLENYLVTRLNITAAEHAEALSQTQVTKIPLGCSIYSIMNQNTNDENSVLVNYYQCGTEDLRGQMLNELTVMNMEEPCFSELRSKLQLGYEVAPSHQNTFGVIGFSIIVCSQASRFSMECIDSTLESFLEKYNVECIQAMTQASFEKFISSAIKLKSSDDANLSEEVNRHWKEIVQQTYMFNRHELEISALKAVTLAELKRWGQNNLIPISTRRKLSMQVTGHSRAPSNANRTQLVGKRRKKDSVVPQQITDIDLFKSSCEQYSFKRQR